MIRTTTTVINAISSISPQGRYLLPEHGDELQRPHRPRISVVQYAATRSVTSTKTDTQHDQR